MRLIYLHQPDELASPPTFIHADEDFWQNRVAPTPLTFRRLDAWTFDQNEQASGLQIGLDFADVWQNPVAPVRVYPVPQVFTFDDTFVAPAPVLRTDEDLWSVRPGPVWAFPVPRVFLSDDETQIVPPCVDEDFWVNPVAPVWSYRGIAFSDDDVFQIEPPAMDETYWQNATTPLQAANWLRLPYLPDPEEIAAASLYGPPAPTVLGVGVAVENSGVGVAGIASGLGQIIEASGEGRVN
jgi:hypothetical protein